MQSVQQVTPILSTLLLLSSHAAAFYMHRVDRATFVEAPSMFHDVPVVVADVISRDDCQQWTRHILRRSKGELLQVHRRGQEDATMMTLTHAVERASQQSSHSDPLYALSVGSSCSTDQLALQDILHDLLATETNRDYDDHFDWLSSCFAKHVPVSDTLVVAGAGSSSPTLQWQPFTSIYACLQGSMLIRALVPFTNNPLPLEAESSVSPIWRPAWEEGLRISHGYQSSPKYSLFEYRHQETILKAEEDGMSIGANDDYEEEKYDDYQDWVERMDLLRPNISLKPSSEEGDNHGELWHSTVVLPGDVVMIPPGWWYQLYHMEPCLAVQSQRCSGSRQAQRFMSHILETAGTSSLNKLDRQLQKWTGIKEDFHTPQEAQAIVNNLFDYLVEERNKGKDNGDLVDDDNQTLSSNFGGSTCFM